MKSRCYILKLDCRMFSFSVKRHKERPLAENTQKGAFSTLFPFHLKNVIFTQKLRNYGFFILLYHVKVKPIYLSYFLSNMFFHISYGIYI